jgi:hypothetical protein
VVISNLKIGTSYFFTLLKEFAKENIRYQNKYKAITRKNTCRHSRHRRKVEILGGKQRVGPQLRQKWLVDEGRQWGLHAVK